MMTRDLSYGAAAADPSRARLSAAAALRAASVLLARLARRLRRSERQPAGEPVFEFYAEAGAPEGALYMDGRLVAMLPGVQRL